MLRRSQALAWIVIGATSWTQATGSNYWTETGKTRIGMPLVRSTLSSGFTFFVPISKYSMFVQRFLDDLHRLVVFRNSVERKELICARMECDYRLVDSNWHSGPIISLMMMMNPSQQCSALRCNRYRLLYFFNFLPLSRQLLSVLDGLEFHCFLIVSHRSLVEEYCRLLCRRRRSCWRMLLREIDIGNKVVTHIRSDRRRFPGYWCEGTGVQRSVDSISCLLLVCRSLALIRRKSIVAIESPAARRPSRHTGWYISRKTLSEHERYFWF